MGYTEQQKNKISKYYYRMNKACNQQNVTKISNYFDHLKYHVMTGGTTTEDVNRTITEISDIITNISNSPEVKGIAEDKENIGKLNSINNSNYEGILSDVAKDNNNPLQAAAVNLNTILEQLKNQGVENKFVQQTQLPSSVKREDQLPGSEAPANVRSGSERRKGERGGIPAGGQQGDRLPPAHRHPLQRLPIFNRAGERRPGGLRACRISPSSPRLRQQCRSQWRAQPGVFVEQAGQIGMTGQQGCAAGGHLAGKRIGIAAQQPLQRDGPSAERLGGQPAGARLQG
jgi:hypothetical protein